MDALISPSSMIKSEAERLGFDGCGISRAEKLNEESGFLQQWLDKGYHAGMTYMENHFEKRVDPRLLVEDAKSVISVIMNYFPAENQSDPEAPVLSKYAYGDDYHDVIRNRLNEVLAYINQDITPCNGRAFVDSAPVLDRAWAAKAGLGWIGKNSNLISPQKGSFFFIGTLLVDIELEYDHPIADFCGDCNRCIRACPTQAIVSPREVDARRCISYLTIENKGPIDPQFQALFQNRVFGCDICQDVCPWNRKSTPHQQEEFKPAPGILEMTKDDWHHMDAETYKKLFQKSAVKRARFSGLQRNLDFIRKEG
jgi:epoxyqueuosine reductase